MTLNASQIVNNIKRSFNRYVGNTVSPAAVNYDEDPFDISGLSAWFAVRYTGYSSEPTGMGDEVEENTEAVGRFRLVNCEVSAWHRDDPQRTALGAMADILVAMCETPSIVLYDYTNPQNPVECGTVYVRPIIGRFTPTWGGGGPVRKTSSDMHAEAGLVGFVLELELKTIAEVDLC
jgi:hypothetical protein